MVSKRPSPAFRVGDTVTIVSRPNKDCLFGWVKDMDRVCGKVDTISAVKWFNRDGVYAYYLNNTGFAWTDNCFEEYYCNEHNALSNFKIDDMDALL